MDAAGILTPVTDPEELITCKEAAGILKLSVNTVRDSKGGTESLLRIRRPNGPTGKPIVRLLKAEVLALRSRWIAEAKEQSKFTPAERALRKLEGLSA